MTEEVKIQEAYERWLARRLAQDKLDKLSRMADPLCNDNLHERDVAKAKLDELNFKLYGAPTEYKNGWPEKISYWWTQIYSWTIAILLVGGFYYVLGFWGSIFASSPKSPTPLSARAMIVQEQFQALDDDDQAQIVSDWQDEQPVDDPGPPYTDN